MPAAVKWQVKIIVAAQAALTAELAGVAQSRGAEEVWPHLLAALQACSHNDTASQDLRHFLLVLAALRFNQQHATATPRQVRELFAVGEALLHAHGIKAGSSRLSFLHADLRAATNFEDRRGGHWLAAWKQTQVLTLAHASPTHELAQRLLLAKRLLRVGHAQQALQHLQGMDDSSMVSSDDEQSISALHLKLRILHLLGQIGAARNLVTAAAAASAPPFLPWLEACLSVSAAAAPGPMLRCISRGGPYTEDVEHQLEASLWFRAIADRTWTSRLTLVRTLARKRSFSTDAAPALYKAALALEQCEDGEVPLPVRVSQLGTILSKAARLATVEQELLLWLAGTRFLLRHRLYAPAALAFGEYAALSQRLCGRDDALGLAADLPLTSSRTFLR